MAWRLYVRILKWAGTGGTVLSLGLGLLSLRWSLHWSGDWTETTLHVEGAAVRVFWPVGPGRFEFLSFVGPGWHMSSAPARSASAWWVKYSPGPWCASLSVPLWLPVAFLTTATAALWLIDGRLERPGHCARCGYDLAGNVSGRCPECGTEAGHRADAEA